MLKKADSHACTQKVETLLCWKLNSKSISPKHSEDSTHLYGSKIKKKCAFSPYEYCTPHEFTLTTTEIVIQAIAINYLII